VYNYNKEFDRRRKLYVQSVTENSSFIRGELDFAATKFFEQHFKVIYGVCAPIGLVLKNIYKNIL
jgi:hypothetical protein